MRPISEMTKVEAKKEYDDIISMWRMCSNNAYLAATRDKCEHHCRECCDCRYEVVIDPVLEKRLSDLGGFLDESN